MKGWRRHAVRSLIIVVVAGSAIGAAAQFAAKRDVSGTWDMEVMTSTAGDTEAIAILRQVGLSVSGRYVSTFGESDLSGTVLWPKLEFAAAVKSGSRDYFVFYSGTVDSDLIKGVVRVEPGSGTGTFTARRRRE